MKLLNVLHFLISAFGYPLLILGGLVYLQYSASKVALLCLALLMLQLILKFPELKTQLKKFMPLSIGLFLIYSLSFIFNNQVFMRLTPLLISAYFFIIFCLSLFRPPSMIERFARLKEKDLPPKAIPYCRNITKIWMGFFIINASIALWTVFQDIKVWALYNGLISYILIGVLFTSEWLYRYLVIQKNSNKQST